jgi:hypothetical protein
MCRKIFIITNTKMRFPHQIPHQPLFSSPLRNMQSTSSSTPQITRTNIPFPEVDFSASDTSLGPDHSAHGSADSTEPAFSTSRVLHQPRVSGDLDMPAPFPVPPLPFGQQGQPFGPVPAPTSLYAPGRLAPRPCHTRNQRWTTWSRYPAAPSPGVSGLDLVLCRVCATRIIPHTCCTRCGAPYP